MAPANTLATFSAAIAILSISVSLFLNSYTISIEPRQTASSVSVSPSLLREIAADQFSWRESTTHIPISAVSVLVKHLLAKDVSKLPRGLHRLIPTDDTVHVQAVRDYANLERLARVKAYCRKHECNFQETDPYFGLTPLHLAAFSGDEKLSEYLLQQGAKPVPDHVDRLPRNLSFASFIPNSKKWAKQAGRTDCEFPVVEFDGSDEAKAEVRRLVSEGEPILIRGGFQYYAPETKDWKVETMIEEYGDLPVTVGNVPYAGAFNLTTNKMTMREYYDRFVVPESDAPMYVFNKGAEVCRSGYNALAKLIGECFPTPQLMAHPDETGGVDGIHYFFGKRGSGAPFHIHADAINAAVHGTKRWFVHTPGKTVYSRKTIKKWVDEDYPKFEDDNEKPLECIQRAGDAIYVPLDWGHAVINTEENTFGFALELLNRRDTFSHIWR